MSDVVFSPSHNHNLTGASQDRKDDPESRAIWAEGISKRFSRHGRIIQALENVSFSPQQGSVFCILGHNGAGKTTLLRILTTITRPSEGTASICGFDIQKNIMQVRQQIGIVTQENHFDKYLTLWQNLCLHAQLHGIPKKEYEGRITELLHQVNLYERRYDYTDEFSGGMQRRAVLIRALIHKPTVLFLDEPSTGLDPEARREIWETIEQFKSWATVVLTTHYMEEADALSDQVMILNAGKVVMRGTPTELKRAISPKNTFDVIFHAGKADDYLPKLQALQYPEVNRFSRNHLRVTLPEDQPVEALLSQLDWADIQQVGETQVDMETVYMAAAVNHSAPTT
ncbi:MAG: ABC transporter ATP-binding protein [Vampirovibrionales bacterium]|nr:ABC transporter ATP-binding protein [Vampirovibrionales bacterium]